jgi:hypothetical protein
LQAETGSPSASSDEGCDASYSPSVGSVETRSEMLQADARVSDLPYPVSRTRAPTFHIPRTVQPRLCCPSAWPMTWLSGMVVQIQSTLPSAKLPAPLLDGGEQPTPWDQPSVTASHLLVRRQEPRVVRRAAVVRCLVRANAALRPPSIYLPSLVCVVSQGLASQSWGPADLKLKIGAGRRKPGQPSRRREKSSQVQKHQAAKSTSPVRHDKASRLHRLNPMAASCTMVPAVFEGQVLNLALP